VAESQSAADRQPLSEQVDFEYLRRYLAAQIIATYLRVTGREGKFGPLRALAAGARASIVDPWVSQIVNPENLIELIRGGTVQSEFGDFFQDWRIAESLPEYRVESLARQRAVRFFDWIAC
jgi:hypothetical protein